MGKEGEKEKGMGKRKGGRGKGKREAGREKGKREGKNGERVGKKGRRKERGKGKEKPHNKKKTVLEISVSDPYHFDLDSDPRIRIRDE